MALAFMITTALVLVALGLIGSFRDLQRGLLALIGTLVGVLLVDFWAGQLGPNLASRFGGDVARVTFVVSCVLFLWCVLFVGYGGGLALSRSKDRMLFPQRIAGALLGVLNGALIVSFFMRFATTREANFGADIQNLALTQILHDGLPWLFVGVAVIATLLVLIRAVMAFTARRAARRTTPPPAAPAATPTAAPSTGTAAPAARVGDRDVLNKIKDANRR